MIIFSTIVTIVISISPVITVFDNDPKMGNSWWDQNLSFWIKKTVELHMKTLKPFPINFFHDYTWFEPKISEMKILKFHDYNELWGLMCKSKTARNIHNPVHVLEQRTVFNKKDFSLKKDLIKNNFLKFPLSSIF